jgi:hypothetical protein
MIPRNQQQRGQIKSSRTKQDVMDFVAKVLV